jgi:2'-5' RNA ligase
MAEKHDRIRLFVGVEIALAAVRELGVVAEALRRKARAAGLQVRWVAPEHYHVTLAFLGWTRPEAVLAIADVLAEPIATVGEFNIAGRGLGAFPSADRARVLWAGVNDPGAGLSRLADIVATTLEPVGFARASRPFHAHVTLGRIREPADVQGLLGGVSEKMFREARVSAVTLFESVLKSTGSEYQPRARFGLREAVLAAKRHTESLQAVAKAAGTSRAGRVEAGGSAGTDVVEVVEEAAGASGWHINQFHDDEMTSSRAGSAQRAPSAPSALGDDGGPDTGYGDADDDDDQA